MTAANTTPAATTDITIGDQMWQLAKGDDIAITTTTGENLTGQFVSLTPRGLRMRVDSKYVTRKMSVVTDIEVRGDDAAPATGETTVFADPAQPDAIAAATERAQAYANTHHLKGEAAADLIREVVAAAAPAAPILTDAAVDESFAALVQATAAAQAAESNEDAPAADYDRNPMVGGRRLSEMRFAEVMDLAKKYKTPGRGVARIDALRDGVAKAISLEIGRLASAN